MDLRLDRVGLLLDQLTSSVEFSRERLDGLGDEEYLWEAVPGAWSIHPRGQARTADAFGPGEWVMDRDSPPPDPAPVSTIAWRLNHVLAMFAGRWEWTFGARATDPADIVDFDPSAARTAERTWAAVDRWIGSVGAMTDAQLDTPGFGQYPWGLDPQLPFVGIVWWNTREFIHHMAEIALLRDLYLRR